MRRLQKEKKSNKWMRRLGLILLALVCVAGVELAVCRVMDPALYRRVTQPVVQLAQSALARGQGLVQSLEQAAGELGRRLTPDSGEEAVQISQAIQEPAQSSPLLQDPAITQFVQNGDRETLTGGVVELVYFNQGEEPWAGASYGPDLVRGYGCGPTAMSMVVSTLTGQVVDPARMAQLSNQQGYCAPGSGSYLSIVEGMAAQFGLTAHSCGEITADELCRRLASGQVLVALMGPGHFTSGGHFIVLRGATLTGQVLVADPNSRERSLALWDPQLILDELSASRANGAPLWSFSAL